MSTMKPLVRRYNQDKAALDKRRQEAGDKLREAREFADRYVQPIYNTDYEHFWVFAEGFLNLLLDASIKHEYANSDVRWKIRQILKEMHTIPEWVKNSGLDPNDALREPPGIEQNSEGDYVPERTWNMYERNDAGFGTHAVLCHFMHSWVKRFNVAAGLDSVDEDRDLVEAIAKAVCDFRAPIDADRLKALLGLLYG